MTAGDLIQIVPPHHWAGCIAIVDEPRTWGVVAYVLIPHMDGTPPGQAFIRLATADFIWLGLRLPAADNVSQE